MNPPLLQTIIEKQKGIPPFKFSKIGSKQRGPCDECTLILHIRGCGKIARATRAYMAATWSDMKHPLCAVHAELWKKITAGRK